MSLSNMIQKWGRKFFKKAFFRILRGQAAAVPRSKGQKLRSQQFGGSCTASLPNAYQPYCAAQKKAVTEQSRVPDLQLGSTTMADDGGRPSMVSPAPKKRAIASSSFITSSPMNPSAKKQRGGRTSVATGEAFSYFRDTTLSPVAAGHKRARVFPQICMF
jgi:hypothetical protein